MSEYELWNEIGNLYFLSGAHTSAVHAYTKAIEMDSQFGRPYSNLALVYVQQGQYERATGLYRRSIELLSDSREKAISWIRLGDVYRQLKDYHRAVDAYQEADRLYPDPHGDRDQPGRDTEVPLAISMPAFHVSTPPAEQSNLKEDSGRAPLPDGQQGADRAVVVSPVTEISPPILEMSSAPAPAVLNPLLSVEESDEINDFNFQSDGDICEDPLNECLPPPDDDWFPLFSEGQEYDHTDMDETAIQSNWMADEEKPPLAANARELEPGFVKHKDVSISGESSDNVLETVSTKPAEVESNLRDESDLGNPASVPATEDELHLKAVNDSEADESIRDLILPDDTIPFVVVVVCQDKAAPILLPEEKPNTQETEINEQKKIVDLNPYDALAWDALGSLYKTNGQYKDAIFAYEQAIAIETNNPSFHYHLGLVYAAANRDEDALRLFKKVVALDPNYGLAHATLSNFYRRMGLEELARQHINKALNNTFQNESEYNRACLESICGNADRALEYLELALQSRQSYADWALHDPDLDFVRNDPRFHALIARFATQVKIDNDKRYEKAQMVCS